ncbi:MAG: lipopolysaccharide heptosyltransferase II [Planctomycetes bacterium]|nr:lipopolysaccharide heptosyltransferase II [Planctomycetota bacterium]
MPIFTSGGGGSSRKVTTDYMEYKRILVKIPNWLGDAVMSLPTLKALRDLFPKSHIAALAKSGLAGLFKNEPAVDEVVSYENVKGIGKFGAEVSLTKEIRGKKFDLLLILPRSFHSALQGFMSGIAHRIGYAAEGRSALLTTALPRTKELLKRHRVQYFLNLLTPLAGSKEITVTKPLITIPTNVQQWAKGQLHSVVGGDPATYGVARHAALMRYSGKGQYLIGVNPSATYGPAKCWPVERYIELVKQLLKKGDINIILVGGRGDEEKLAERIISACGNNRRVMDFTGKTSVLQLAGLLKCCDVLVTNDTGPMHVAAAVGTSIVALFGSTDPVTTGPFAESQSRHECRDKLRPDSHRDKLRGGADKDKYTIIRKDVTCAPCLKRVCPTNHKCMKLITVDEVLSNVVRYL